LGPAFRVQNVLLQNKSRYNTDQLCVVADVELPEFSPRHVTIRNDRDFTDEFRTLDFLGRQVLSLYVRLQETLTNTTNVSVHTCYFLFWGSQTRRT